MYRPSPILSDVVFFFALCIDLLTDTVRFPGVGVHVRKHSEIVVERQNPNVHARPFLVEKHWVLVGHDHSGAGSASVGTFVEFERVAVHGVRGGETHRSGPVRGQSVGG